MNTNVHYKGDKMKHIKNKNHHKINSKSKDIDWVEVIEGVANIATIIIKIMK